MPQRGLAEPLLMETRVQQPRMMMLLAPSVFLRLALGVDANPVGMIFQIARLAVLRFRPFAVDIPPSRTCMSVSSKQV